jgi:quercetin dioxygenase-like cupin family protein
MEEKMKLHAIATALAMSVALGWIGLAGFASVASAEEAHAIIAPNEIKWGPAPKVLPPGAEAAVLFGDPSKEGLFALRVKLPAGYAIPPHTHPVIEAVTVISGTFKLGMGEAADQSATKALPTGSFFALPTGMAHFVYIDEPTVIQISTTGPWGLTYVNPKDDPRTTQ